MKTIKRFERTANEVYLGLNNNRTILVDLSGDYGCYYINVEVMENGHTHESSHELATGMSIKDARKDITRTYKRLVTQYK